MTAQRVLEIAQAEIGTKESPANSNRVKYNTAYYGREVAGSSYPWCAVFVWWVFRQAGASALFYGGKKTASCPVLLNYHKQQGQSIGGDYRPGDVIFFNFSGSGGISHVGICESWDGQYITTIDGNTGSGNEANGGAVMCRLRAKKYIVGAYRPQYEEEIDMTEGQLRDLIREELQKIEAERATLPASGWASEHIATVVKAGIMSDVGGKNIDRPRSVVTREELATVAAKILERCS